MIVIRPINYRPPAAPEDTSEDAVPAPATENESTAALQEELRKALDPRFEVLDCLAIGGMATLFLVRHRVHLGLLVAKVLQPALAARPEVVAAFEREARHVARLGNHPNLIPVFDLVQANGLHILLMPYVEGEDLDHLLQRRGKLTRDEALTLLTQITGLLIHAEEQGIVHGDLSPGNIRLDNFGQYRVFDFGLSLADDDEPVLRLPRAGTPTYNSPEQIRQEPLDNRSDLYSLGVLFAEAFEGHAPFEAETLEELEQKHLRGKWKASAELEADPRLKKLLERLLALQPQDRFGDASQLASSIAGLGFELASNQPSPPGALLVPPRPRRRRLA